MASTVTSKELRERQDEYTYVDVREADELEEGMIEEAMNISLGLLVKKARNGDLDDLKRKKIVTYCNGGMTRATPEKFQFSIKVPETITHVKRLDVNKGAIRISK